MRHYNENRVIFQGLPCNRNNVFTYIWMKLPDCAFNIDIKSAFNFWDPIILLGVTVCQRGAGIKKHPVHLNDRFCLSIFLLLSISTRRRRSDISFIWSYILWVHVFTFVTCGHTSLDLKTSENVFLFFGKKLLRGPLASKTGGSHMTLQFFEASSPQGHFFKKIEKPFYSYRIVNKWRPRFKGYKLDAWWTRWWFDEDGYSENNLLQKAFLQVEWTRFFKNLNKYD